MEVLNEILNTPVDTWNFTIDVWIQVKHKYTQPTHLNTMYLLCSIVTTPTGQVQFLGLHFQFARLDSLPL